LFVGDQTVMGSYHEIKLRGVFSHDSQSVIQAIQLAELRKYPLGKKWLPIDFH